MAAVNTRRVLLGALAGGVVWNIWSVIINTAVLSARYQAAQQAGTFPAAVSISALHYSVDCDVVCACVCRLVALRVSSGDQWRWAQDCGDHRSSRRLCRWISDQLCHGNLGSDKSALPALVDAGTLGGRNPCRTRSGFYLP